MDYIEPKKVNKGDTIGIISPSGAIISEESVACGVNKLESLGFKVKLSEHLFDKKRYLAGEDDIRAGEIEKFFADDDVDCILCARGGYGAIRILDRIDYDIIRNNPKAFCGYSDITAFSAMFLKHAQLISYSSPMLCGDFGSQEVCDFTVDSFIQAISGAEMRFEISGNRDACAEGIAWGGNLTTLATLCGREFVPEEDFILFIEDVNEPVYKIDRALSQLASISQFKQSIRGIVAGDFSGTSNADELSEVLNEYSKNLDCPLWKDLKWGHEKEKVTITIGKRCLVRDNLILN